MLKIYVMAFLGRVIFYPYLYRYNISILNNKLKKLFKAFAIIDVILMIMAIVFIQNPIYGFKNFIWHLSYFFFYAELYAFLLLFSFNTISYILKRYFIDKYTYLEKKVSNKTVISTLNILLYIIPILIMIESIYEVRFPKMKYQNIYIDSYSKDGSYNHNMKAILLSDIHIGPSIDVEMLRKYVDMTVKENPDIVFIAGDIIEYDLAYADRDDINNEFRRIKPKYGVYAVLGNHEYKDSINIDKTKDWIYRLGYNLLIDTVVYPMNESFSLIGRDDYENTNMKPIGEISRNLRKDIPKILLSHNPKSLDSLDMNNYDFAMYGHSHRGQFFPMHILTRLRLSQISGYGKNEKAQYYISKGLGTSGPSYRFLAHSEIICLNIFW